MNQSWIIALAGIVFVIGLFSAILGVLMLAKRISNVPGVPDHTPPIIRRETNLMKLKAQCPIDPEMFQKNLKYYSMVPTGAVNCHRIETVNESSVMAS